MPPQSRIQKLVDDIDRLRLSSCNYEQKKFVSNRALEKLMTESAIREVLEELRIPSADLETLSRGILQGGQMVFAILLLVDNAKSIGLFLSNDYRQAGIDSRLPHNRETLSEILSGYEGDSDCDLIASRFEEKQWSFALPKFESRMMQYRFPSSTVIPILERKLVAEGGFGDIFKVKLHPDCHILPVDGNEVR